MTDSPAGATSEGSRSDRGGPTPPTVFTLSATGAEVEIELIRPLPGDTGLLMRPGNGGPGDRVVVKRLRERHSAVVAGRLDGLAALDHPAIAPILGWGNDDEGLYLVRDYVQGRTVDDVLALHEKLTAAQLLEVGIGLCGALDHAHTRRPRIVHARLTPNNVFLTTGTEQPKLVDFAVGSLIEPRTDIKALGILLLRLFAQCGAAAHLPSGSDRVMRRAQTQGYDSAADFGNALTRLLTGHQEQAALERDPTVRIETGETRRVVVCPNPDCSEVNSADAKACARCDQELWKTCSACGEDYLPQESRCPHCRTDPEKIEKALELIAAGRSIFTDGDALGANRIVERGIRLLSREEGATAALAEAGELRIEIRELLDLRDKLAKDIQGLLAAHRYDDALRGVEASLDEDPGNKDALQLLEEIPRRKRAYLLALSLEAEATHDMNRTLNLATQAASGASPDEAEARERLAAVRKKVGALAAFQKQLKKLQQDKDFAGMLAACEGADDEVREHPLVGKAKSWAERRIEAHRQRLEEADTALSDQGWSEAIRLFKEAGKLWPLDERAPVGQKRVIELWSDSLVEDGHKALRKGDYMRASLAFEQAKDVRPGNTAAQKGLKKLRSRRRRRRLAKVAVVLILLVAIGAFGAAGPIANVLLEKGEYEYARLIYDEVPVVVQKRELQAGLAKFLDDRAEKSAAVKDYDSALADLDEAATILGDDKDEPAAYGALAETSLAAAIHYRDAERLEEALAIANSGAAAAIRAGPEYAELRARLVAMRTELEAALRSGVLDVLKRDAVLAFQTKSGVVRLPSDGEVTRLSLAGGTADCESRDGMFLVPVEFEEEGPVDLELVAHLGPETTLEFPLRVVCDATKPRLAIAGDELRMRPGRSMITVEVKDESLEWGVPLARVWVTIESDGSTAEGAALPNENAAASGQCFEFECDVSTVSGEEVPLTVHARDLAGNEAHAPLRLVADCESEPITLGATGGRAFGSGGAFATDQPKIVLEGVTADILPRCGSLRECRIEAEREGRQREVIGLRREDVSAGENGGTVIRREVTLAPGENRFVMHIRDEAGNEAVASKEILVVRDLEPPVVSILPIARTPDRWIREATDGPTVLANRRVEIVVQVKERWLDTLTVTADGVTREVEPDNGRFAVVVSRAGPQTIKVVAVDAVGATATATLPITFYPLGANVTIRDGSRLIHTGPVGGNLPEREMVFVSAGDIEGDKHVRACRVGAFLFDKDETPSPGGKISFADARNHAARRGLMLPTEAEWLRAVSSEKSRPGSINQLGDQSMEWVVSPGREFALRGRVGEGQPTGQRSFVFVEDQPMSAAYRCVLRLGR